MTTQTLTLTDFLLARIAEDEAVAQVATGGPWVLDLGDVDGPKITSAHKEPFWGLVVSGGDDGRGGIYRDEDASHIARHDPARVLAECEAKRRIVEAFEEERTRRDIYNRDYNSGDYDFNENDLRSRLASNAHCRGLEIAMLALALPYADHPDYDESWRP